jgi:hypothetical protein
MDKNIVICVTGWHFGYEFYYKICQLQDVDVYVVSHRNKSDIPTNVYSLFPESHILIRENVGYDWGCYQQFLESDIWRKYQYIFFIHDDVNIVSLDFVDASIRLLSSGYKFVGNGKNSNKRDWPQTHLACYAHSLWTPPSLLYQHDTMRGSFFATTRDALQKLGSFEVFWDRFRLNIRFGNWSLISSCGKIQSIFGENSFIFLSDNYLNSSFLEEYERGGKTFLDTHKTLRQTIIENLLFLFIFFSKEFVHQKMLLNANKNLFHPLYLFYGTIIRIISMR